MTNLFFISVIVILSSFFFRTRTLLNEISWSITSDKLERNKYEVILQPKWLQNSVWILTAIWLYLGYELFQSKVWWSIIYFIGFLFSVVIVSRLLPIPTKTRLLNLFNSTIDKRLSNNARYNNVEIYYLKTAKEALDNIRKTGNVKN